MVPGDVNLLNMSQTDLELLAHYASHDAEDSFAELVKRHLDLVYSAALRQVRSPQLAEEVSQVTFIQLAHHTKILKPDTVLTAWLYQVTSRTAIDAVRHEARRQMREQIATELNSMNAPSTEWVYIEPLLDEAMQAIDEADRTAILLRYFENKSLREVGAILVTTEDAVQKRVSRAVERLRDFFTKRGVTVGSSAIAIGISTHAVQSAPVGLAIPILTAATLAVGAVTTSTTIVAAKTVSMTTVQKTLMGATLIVAVGAGIYETWKASQLREQKQNLSRRQQVLTGQIQQMLAVKIPSPPA